MIRIKSRHKEGERKKLPTGIIGFPYLEELVREGRIIQMEELCDYSP